MRPEIWGIGLVALDLIIASERSEPSVAAGGTCGNVLSILSRLGWHATPIARLGKDAASKKVESDLCEWGVDIRFLHLRPTAKTPVIVERIRTDSSGLPFHTFSFSCPACGQRLPSFQPVTVRSVSSIATGLADVDVLFVDRASASSIKLAEEASNLGVIVFFEPSAHSSRAHFSALIELAHIIKYSHDRVDSIGHDNWGSRTLLEIQTLGRGGLRFRTKLASNMTWRNLAAQPVARLRDAAGSGDWLSSALIYSICRGGVKRFRSRSLAEVVRGLNFGQALAAWNCEFSGARGGMYNLSPSQFWSLVKRAKTGQAPQLSNDAPMGPEVLTVSREICQMCDRTPLLIRSHA